MSSDPEGFVFKNPNVIPLFLESWKIIKLLEFVHTVHWSKIKASFKEAHNAVSPPFYGRDILEHLTQKRLSIIPEKKSKRGLIF